MLFWIRNFSYANSPKRKEKLKEFFIQNTDFLHSEREYEFLDKSFHTLRRLHRKERDIVATLLGFVINKQLSQDLHGEDIESFLHENLSEDFSLQAFFSRHEYEK